MAMFGTGQVRFVDGAFASPGVKERAVSVSEFGEGDFAADDAGMEQADFADGLTEVIGDFLEFFVGDPNCTRCTVQQSPHWVQVKLRPSAYHGCGLACGSGGVESDIDWGRRGSG